MMSDPEIKEQPFSVGSEHGVVVVMATDKDHAEVVAGRFWNDANFKATETVALRPGEVISFKGGEPALRAMIDKYKETDR
jgi:hypothetical protein